MRATFRAAAITAGTVTALALPMGTAFADSPTRPPSPSAFTPADEGGKSKGWADKGTVDLGDGYTASVKVNASAKTAQAEICAQKAVVGNVEATGKVATKKFNEYTFTLTADGILKKAKADTKPAKPVSGISIGGSTMAELSNTAAEGPKAVLKIGPGEAADGRRPGTHVGTLTKKSPRYENNGMKAEIVKADSAKPQLKVSLPGEGTKYYDFPAVGKPGGEQRPGSQKPGQGTPPKGGVRAGAEGVVPPHGSAGLIAGGVGMAAVGAAGLGFAMMRRSRSES